MENLMFWGMFIACLLISAMTFYILNLQRMVNIDLRRKYNDLQLISANTLAKLKSLSNSKIILNDLKSLRKH